MSKIKLPCKCEKARTQHSKMKDQVFERWMADPLLQHVKNISWVGVAASIPDGYVATDRPSHDYHVDAIFVCCEMNLCRNYRENHLTPMGKHCLVFVCPWRHSPGYESCIFRRVTKNVAFQVVSNSVHDPNTETCFPALTLAKIEDATPTYNRLIRKLPETETAITFSQH
jgi:hypothetical protein